MPDEIVLNITEVVEDINLEMEDAAIMNFAARLIPAGGTTGQVLAKSSGNNYQTHWVDQNEGGGEASVETVNGVAPDENKNVELTPNDIGAEVAGASAAALSSANSYTDNALQNYEQSVKVLAMHTTPMSHTGNTVETKMNGSILVPAGACQANDKWRLLLRGLGTNSNNHTIRVYVNTLDSLESAVPIATATFTITANYITRHMWFNNVLNKLSNAWSGAASLLSDLTSSLTHGNMNTAPTGAGTFDFSSNFYLIFSIQNANSGDTTTIFEYSLERLRTT